MTFDFKKNKMLRLTVARRELKARVKKEFVDSGAHKAMVDSIHAKRGAERISPEDTGF